MALSGQRRGSSEGFNSDDEEEGSHSSGGGLNAQGARVLQPSPSVAVGVEGAPGRLPGWLYTGGAGWPGSSASESLAASARAARLGGWGCGWRHLGLRELVVDEAAVFADEALPVLAGGLGPTLERLELLKCFLGRDPATARRGMLCLPLWERLGTLVVGFAGPSVEQQAVQLRHHTAQLRRRTGAPAGGSKRGDCSRWVYDNWVPRATVEAFLEPLASPLRGPLLRSVVIAPPVDVWGDVMGSWWLAAAARPWARGCRRGCFRSRHEA